MNMIKKETSISHPREAAKRDVGCHIIQRKGLFLRWRHLGCGALCVLVIWLLGRYCFVSMEETLVCTICAQKLHRKTLGVTNPLRPLEHPSEHIVLLSETEEYSTNLFRFLRNHSAADVHSHSCVQLDSSYAYLFGGTPLFVTHDAPPLSPISWLNWGTDFFEAQFRADPSFVSRLTAALRRVGEPEELEDVTWSLRLLRCHGNWAKNSQTWSILNRHKHLQEQLRDEFGLDIERSGDAQSHPKVKGEPVP